MAEYVTPKSLIRSRKTRPSRFQRVQNFILIRLDSNIDETQPDVEQSLTQLRCIVTTINTFTNVDRCLDFLNQLEKVKVFLIISGALGQSTLPLIHDRPELDSIYVLCGNKAKNEALAEQWPLHFHFSLVKQVQVTLCNYPSYNFSFVADKRSHKPLHITEVHLYFGHLQNLL